MKWVECSPAWPQEAYRPWRSLSGCLGGGGVFLSWWRGEESWEWQYPLSCLGEVPPFLSRVYPYVLFGDTPWSCLGGPPPPPDSTGVPPPSPPDRTGLTPPPRPPKQDWERWGANLLDLGLDLFRSICSENFMQMKTIGSGLPKPCPPPSLYSRILIFTAQTIQIYSLWLVPLYFEMELVQGVEAVEEWLSQLLVVHLLCVSVHNCEPCFLPRISERDNLIKSVVSEQNLQWLCCLCHFSPSSSNRKITTFGTSHSRSHVTALSATNSFGIPAVSAEVCVLITSIRWNTA